MIIDETKEKRTLKRLIEQLSMLLYGMAGAALYHILEGLLK